MMNDGGEALRKFEGLAFTLLSYLLRYDAKDVYQAQISPGTRKHAIDRSHMAVSF